MIRIELEKWLNREFKENCLKLKKNTFVKVNFYHTLRFNTLIAATCEAISVCLSVGCNDFILIKIERASTRLKLPIYSCRVTIKGTNEFGNKWCHFQWRLMLRTFFRGLLKKSHDFAKWTEQTTEQFTKSIYLFLKHCSRNVFLSVYWNIE